MESLRPELLFVESGGDNLAAQFSRDLADYTIYVIDVSGGDKIPRKGGPGITQSDLLIINKTDLAPLVGADLGVMERDARKMRGDGPFLFTQVKNDVGVEEVVSHVTRAWKDTKHKQELEDQENLLKQSPKLLSPVKDRTRAARVRDFVAFLLERPDPVVD